MKQSFTTVRVGRYDLPSRLVMAPMARPSETRRPAAGRRLLCPTRQRRLDFRRRHAALRRRTGLPRDLAASPPIQVRYPS
jgi:hypothetical protein